MKGLNARIFLHELEHIQGQMFGEENEHSRVFESHAIKDLEEEGALERFLVKEAKFIISH